MDSCISGSVQDSSWGVTGMSLAVKGGSLELSSVLSRDCIFETALELSL